jgi:hypothetical protein
MRDRSPRGSGHSCGSTLKHVRRLGGTIPHPFGHKLIGVALLVRVSVGTQQVINKAVPRKRGGALALIERLTPREYSPPDIATSEHPTCLSQRLCNGQTEIVTLDLGVRQKAEEARQERAIVTFTFWNGIGEETIQGAVMTCRSNPPFHFTVEPRPV